MSSCGREHQKDLSLRGCGPSARLLLDHAQLHQSLKQSIIDGETSRHVTEGPVLLWMKLGWSRRSGGPKDRHSYYFEAAECMRWHRTGGAVAASVETGAKSTEVKVLARHLAQSNPIFATAAGLK